MSEPAQLPHARYSFPTVDPADPVSRKRSVGGTRVGDRRGNAPAFEGDGRVDPEPDFVEGAKNASAPTTALPDRRDFFPSLTPSHPHTCPRAVAYDSDGPEASPPRRSRGRPRAPRARSEPPLCSPRRLRRRTSGRRLKFSPDEHLHVRVDAEGHPRLREGAGKKTGEEDRRDLKGQRVIWDLALLEETLRQLPGCSCGGRVQFARSEEGALVDKQQGLAHEYAFACDKCHMTLATAPTSAKVPSDGPGRPAMEINRLAVFSGDLRGVRRRAQTKFLNGLGVDGLRDDKSYAAHGTHLQ